MKRGDWSDLLWPIQVCVRKGSIAWPRYVGQVREANLCHHALPMRAINYRFLDMKHHHHWRHLCGQRCEMEQVGNVAIFNDMPVPNWTIRAYPMKAIDAGKTMTFFGVDQFQQPLQHQNPDNSWSDGVTLTLANPFGALVAKDGVTPIYPYRIDRVLRDATQGNVMVYAVNANGIMQDLAIYEPSETNPEYARSMLHLPCHVDCARVLSVIAMIKLRFVPIIADTDLVLINDVEALKNFFQSSRLGESGDIAGKREYEKEAIRALNLKQKDDRPDEQMPVQVEPFSGLHFHNRTF